MNRTDRRFRPIVFVIAPLLGAFLFFCACGEDLGEPVPVETGIIGKWRSETDTTRALEFEKDGTGHFDSTGLGIDMDFTYKFDDADTVTITFYHGEALSLDVRTTTLYFWTVDEHGETERFRKYAAGDANTGPENAASPTGAGDTN